jgi:hypothetical protein
MTSGNAFEHGRGRHDVHGSVSRSTYAEDELRLVGTRLCAAQEGPLQPIQATQNNRNEKCQKAVGFKRNPLAPGMNAAFPEAV